MSDSRFIPNSFQMQNILIDELMFLLTDPEWRVLCYMVRHIIGWQDKIESRQRHMSLTMFVNGYGDYPGCGLNKPAVKAALDSLANFGIISREDGSTANGQLWKLTYDDDIVKWEALKERQQNKTAVRRKQTDKARAIKSGKSDIPVSETNQQRYVTHTGGGKSDIPNQTQVQTQVKDKTAPSGTVPATSINPMKDAIVKAFDWSWNTMTKPEKGTVQTAAKQLCENGWLPEDVQTLYAECKTRGWKNFKPTALLNVASDVRNKIQRKPKISYLTPIETEEWGVDTFLRKTGDAS